MVEELENWLRNAGIESDPPIALAGDVSQRRYFRLRRRDGVSLLATHYPEDLRAAMARFVGARELLDRSGIRVPEILRTDPAGGWMIVEDLGDATIFESGDLTHAEGSVLPGRVVAAVEVAQRVARLDRSAVTALGSPPLDGTALARELDPTFQYLFDPQGLAAFSDDRRAFRLALDDLCYRLAKSELVPCHRDFMARNLLPVSGGVAVIDFQDVRLGPAGYDLASLLNDSYFPDPDLEEALLPGEWKSGGAPDQYSRAVVQRCLKAAGTFARFAARGNRRHVPLIAPTLHRAVRHLERLPEIAASFRPLHAWWLQLLAADPIC
ncbi:MAG: phosphotransferase [Thermoanaerobaculia bacterium]